MIINNIEVEKDDRKCSFAFIARSDDYSDPHFTHLHQYAIKSEELLSKLVKKELKKPKNDPKVKPIKYWWCFKQDDGHYCKYSNEMDAASKLHYKSHIKDESEKTKKLGPLTFKTQYHSYKIEFSSPPNGTGFQVNEQTGKIRRIKKCTIGKDSAKCLSKTLILKPFAKEFPACPSNWIQLENLNFKTSIFNTINVDLASDEAAVVKTAI